MGQYMRKLTLFPMLLLLSMAMIDFAYAEDHAAGADPLVQRGTLVLGKISDNPQVDMEGLQPLVQYVVNELNDPRITSGKVLTARNHQQMLSYLRQGKVDWVSETVGSALILQDRSGAKIRLVRWKHGEHSYRSTVFVRDDSPIENLSDLVGHTLAVEHPGSTTGFLVPATELFRSGLSLALMGSPREMPSQTMVGYFFSGDEINTSSWVHKRLMQAGALADTDWLRDEQVPVAFRTELRKIFVSGELPRGVELVREGMDPDLESRLCEILLSANQSTVGTEILSGYHGTEKYTPYDEADWPYVYELWPDMKAMLAELE